MGQARLKDHLSESEATAEAPVASPPLERKSGLPRFDEYRALSLEDERKEAIRIVARLIAWSAVGASAVLAVAAATGHLVGGLLVLGGLTAATALLVRWGNWILDNTVSW